jgi:DNA topoisomerase II
MADYNAWRNTIGTDEAKKYRIKYYKGLGTSSSAEAKGYFAAFDDHMRPFQWNSAIDGELLDMVFDKKRASDRREWIISEYDETSSLVVNAEDGNAVSYEDFVNKELVHFSQADNIRSIPSVVDGLKPSHRKVLHACFKRKLKSELKVAQLTGYCAEHTAYHHGEASLQSTSKSGSRSTVNYLFLFL